MQIKQIVLTIIIIVALGVAGFFAYKAFFSGPSAIVLVTPEDKGPVQGAILPHGTELDFDIVKKFNKNSKLFPYPVVTPTDIGQELGGLVKL